MKIHIDKNRLFKNSTDDWITYHNILITCINSKIFVSRHYYNKNGNSFMKIEQLSEKKNGHKAICLFFHHCCGFGHVLHGMLHTYSNYLRYKQTLSNPDNKDVKIVHFNTPFHVGQLNKLYARIENKDIVQINDGESVFFSEITFFRHNGKPDPKNSIGINMIRNYIQKNTKANQYRYKKIAILKTTDTHKLDNPWNPRGNLDINKIKKILDKYQITLIRHENLDTPTIIGHILNCDLLITSWGATSAWHSFLKPPQKCFCIVPDTYWHEVIKNVPRFRNICFNPNLFKNYIIAKKPTKNIITVDDIQYLDRELNKIIN